MKKSFILLLLLFASFLQANTFSQSKKILLKQVYFDNQNSFYCNNPYEIKVLDGKEQTLIIEDKLFYTPRNPITKKGNKNPRTKRIEWEHIMSAHNFAHHLACWKEGGRKACNKDKIFQIMEADMHNLVPAIGEVNGDRSNYRYGANKPKVGQYGKCEMEVDFKAKRAYVRDDIKGDIARIYFYMSDKYNINLSKQERQMLEIWNKQDPVSSWERIKNQRVKKLQGYGNKFIQ